MSIIILILSPIIVLIAFHLIGSLVKLPCLFAIWINDANAIDLLNTLSQIQVGVFAIFFSLYSVVIQLQLSTAGTPDLAKKIFRSREFLFIVFVYLLSIISDLVFVKYIEIYNGYNYNVFWFLALAVFAILIIFPYISNTLTEFARMTIINEVLNDKARFDLENVNLFKSHLNRVRLNNRNLKKANLSYASLLQADLSQSDLEYANLSNSNLMEANLSKSNLKNANLSFASLWQANLSESDLEYANLSFSDLKNSHLINANLFKVNLESSILNGANLSGSIISGSILKYSSLVNADFRGCMLISVDLSYTLLAGANLERIMYNDETIKSLKTARDIDKAFMGEDLRYRLNKR